MQAKSKTVTEVVFPGNEEEGFGSVMFRVRNADHVWMDTEGSYIDGTPQQVYAFLKALAKEFKKEFLK